MPSTFVIGDIHGACRALDQCLERSGFNSEKDHLICLGDVGDGWPDTRQAIDRLLSIQNLTYILGNHDFWMLEWMKYDNADEVWLGQGGQATVDSYTQGIPAEHVRFIENASHWFEMNNKLFVHAGIDISRSIDQQDINTFLWDRSLAKRALELRQKGTEIKLSIYDEIYLGHTPVSSGKPVQSGNVWLMDTGAGWSGVLSMMNIDSKELFRSDPVPELYPGVKGRSKY